MNPLDMAVLQLDGLIAGLKMNSSIPIQAAELKMIKMFIEMAQKRQSVPMRSQG